MNEMKRLDSGNATRRVKGTAGERGIGKNEIKERKARGRNGDGIQPTKNKGRNSRFMTGD